MLIKKSKNRRICFVTTLPITLKAFVKPQAEYLIRCGWDVTWICAEDSEFVKVIPQGVKYIPLKFKRGIDLFGIPRAIWTLYRIFKNERFEIVQYSTPNAAFYASTAAMLARIPTRLYAQWGIRYVGFEKTIRQFYKLIERWCCFCSNVIEPDSLSNLNFSKKEKLFTDKKNSAVIWNGSAAGVNIERFDVTQKNNWRIEYRSKEGLQEKHKIIGFVGSICRDKGCNELISACRSFFDEMPDVRLLLIGNKEFYQTIDKDLRAWVASSNQVKYIPPNNEIPQYIACMDIFSLPSYREGFGMVVIEAQAMGIPVVVSDVPGPIDAMRHNETGLIVSVKSVEELAKSLKFLLQKEDCRIEFGKAAAIFARKNFEQKEFMKRVLEDKERLVARVNVKWNK